ncbi:hypothetical protein B0H11DRAFT_1938134 [Mycena galericulata]|nr:hypothetical protein B0H11DRAFT_1938134 [Mycena galericulata]
MRSERRTGSDGGGGRSGSGSVRGGGTWVQGRRGAVRVDVERTKERKEECMRGEWECVRGPESGAELASSFYPSLPSLSIFHSILIDPRARLSLLIASSGTHCFIGWARSWPPWALARIRDRLGISDDLEATRGFGQRLRGSVGGGFAASIFSIETRRRDGAGARFGEWRREEAAGADHAACDGATVRGFGDDSNVGMRLRSEDTDD